MRDRAGSEMGVPETRRGRAVLSCALWMLSAVLTAGSALAQVQQPAPSPSPFPPGFVPPSQERPQAAPPAGSFDFSIETPRRSPVPRAVDELRFQLNGINIVGATVFSPDAF